MSIEATRPTLEYADPRSREPTAPNVAVAFVLGQIAGATFGCFGFHQLSDADPDGVLLFVSLLLAAFAFPMITFGVLYRSRRGDHLARRATHLSAAIGITYGVVPAIGWLIPVTFPDVAVNLFIFGVPLLTPILLFRRAPRHRNPFEQI